MVGGPVARGCVTQFDVLPVGGAEVAEEGPKGGHAGGEEGEVVFDAAWGVGQLHLCFFRTVGVERR